MFSKNFIWSVWKFKEGFGLKQASDCYYKLVTKSLTTNYNLLPIFRSDWTKLKYRLNLVRCFLLHSTKFQCFFMDSKVSCQIHVITDMLKNIWKEYFIKECFSSFSSSRCAIIALLNVIYTKFIPYFLSLTPLNSFKFLKIIVINEFQ